MESPKLKERDCGNEEEKRLVKRRRLGRSLGGRNSSWVPPFATPPPAQKSGGRSSGDAADRVCSSDSTRKEIDNSPKSPKATTGSAQAVNRCSPHITNEKESITTPRSSQPRSMKSLSSRKRSRGDFKSPMRTQVEKKPEETTESIERENEKLAARLSDLDKEITELKEEGLSEEELQIHIKKIHEYNELKDMTQMLLGRIAMLEGVTTRQLHEEMGLGED